MDTKVTANRQKKIEIVAGLNEKIGRSKAIIFTNFEKVTHKQLETLKRAIKPMEAEYVVAKNSLVLRALEENKIKLEGENLLEGPTGTLLLYGDVVSPLKQLAKTIKELGLLNVKLGIMENKFLTGEQVLKISTLPTRDVLLAQVAAGLKSPISGLHRALNWNLQKFVMTLAAVAKAKPAVATPAPVGSLSETKSLPEEGAKTEEVVAEALVETPVNEPEPETILDETPEEKAQEVPAEPVKEEKVEEEVKTSKGGEN
jgi:large subunit ribosomal protein L10